MIEAIQQPSATKQAIRKITVGKGIIWPSTRVARMAILVSMLLIPCLEIRLTAVTHRSV